jgi:hypothetical protein
MGIFGEKYSKEAFGDAQKDVDTQAKLSRERGGALTQEGLNSHAFINEIRERMQKRLDKLDAKGHAEATALNEEYNQLLENAEKALKAVEDFEVTKLGMQK